MRNAHLEEVLAESLLHEDFHDRREPLLLELVAHLRVNVGVHAHTHVCARARACVRACACLCVRECMSVRVCLRVSVRACLRVRVCACLCRLLRTLSERSFWSCLKSSCSAGCGMYSADKSNSSSDWKSCHTYCSCRRQSHRAGTHSCAHARTHVHLEHDRVGGEEVLFDLVAARPIRSSESR